MFIVYELCDPSRPELEFVKGIYTQSRFVFGEIDDAAIVSGAFNLLAINAREITNDELHCYLFVNCARGYVKKKQLDGKDLIYSGSRDVIPSVDGDDPSTRYYLTDADKENTVSLHKKLMSMEVENFFNYRMSSEQQQKNQEAKQNFLTAIENINSWDECLFYYNDRFHEKLENLLV